MAVTQNSYTGNGSTTNYAFTFPYLKSSEIKAQIDATVTTAFTLANATTVQFNTAPANGASIKIYRETDDSALTATFYAGSAIKSEDLNDNFTQNLYTTQEINARYLSNLGDTLNGNLTLGEDATIIFEGATDNAHETTLTVTDPTADRTITLPNVTGTVITTGNGDFGSQAVATTGTLAAGNTTVTGNIAVSGTVDGRDVAADGLKLDDITDSAGVSENLIVTLSESVDGSRTNFTMSTTPATAQNLMVSINGVIQKPNAGTNISGSDEGYCVSGNTLKFATAPANGSSIFIVVHTASSGGSSSLKFLDNIKAKFGTGSDLEIYHDGSNSYINETGTGNLHVRSSSFVLETETGSDAVDVVGEDLVWKTPSGNLGKIDVISVGSGGPHGFGGAMRLYAKNDSSAIAAGSPALPEVVKIDTSGLACTGRLSAYVNATNIEGALFKNTDSGAAAQKMVKFTRHDGNEIGTITQTNSATAYNTSSDYRLKENEVAISDGITRLKTLKPYRFNFKVEPDKTVDGFFAHEVTPAIPEAISGTKDEVDSDDKPIYQGIDQSKLVPLLTAALQEAITKIETLETKVAALEAK